MPKYLFFSCIHLQSKLRVTNITESHTELNEAGQDSVQTIRNRIALLSPKIKN